MNPATGVTSDVLNTLSGWAHQPFNTSMSAGGWFAFFGLIVAISVAWGLILHDLRGEL